MKKEVNFSGLNSFKQLYAEQVDVFVEALLRSCFPDMISFISRIERASASNTTVQNSDPENSVVSRQVSFNSSYVYKIMLHNRFFIYEKLPVHTCSFSHDIDKAEVVRLVNKFSLNWKEQIHSIDVDIIQQFAHYRTGSEVG